MSAAHGKAARRPGASAYQVGRLEQAAEEDVAVNGELGVQLRLEVAHALDGAVHQDDLQRPDPDPAQCA